MSVAIEQASGDALLRDHRPASNEQHVTWPRLLEGTEPIGQAAGSGLRKPPYLVRRCDGEIVQLSQLLYVIASQMDGRGLAAIADGVGDRLDVRITPEQVGYVAEQKLAPLGLVAHRDGSAPILERRTGLLGLRFRAGILSERGVNALVGYILHDMTGEAVKHYLPKDSPAIAIWIGFAIFFFVTWLFLRSLEKQKMYVKL